MPTNLLIMNANKYPFGESSSQNNVLNRTLVKQTLNKSDADFSSLLKTCQLSKKLSEDKKLIRLQRILQQDNTICLHYEYVSIQLIKYIQKMDQNFIKQYRNSMYQLASFLAENRIICDLSIQRMGLSQNYEVKYFLGVQFAQKKQVNIFELKNDYVQDIKMIFQPYLNRKNTQKNLVPKKQTKNLVRVDTRMSDTQQISSNYLDYDDNLIKTRKHQSIYYERTKEHETKRRKQSYMSSVSNLRLNNLYKRINEIELQVCNTRGTGSNGKCIGNGGGFKMSIEGREFFAKSSFGGISSKQSIMEHQERQLQIYKGLNNNSNNNKNLGYLQRNSTTSQNLNNKNNFNSILDKTQKYNFIKYPGYEQQDDEDDHNNTQQSPRYIVSATNKNQQISAHQIQRNNCGVRKQNHKKYSTQFPTLSDLQRPMMALTNTLRISANGLDSRNERKQNKKIQLFKQREYSQIKSVSGNTNYIRDFMSVLQQQTSTNQRTSKNNQNQNSHSNQSQQCISKKHSQIQMYSQQTIENVGFTPFTQKLTQKRLKQTLSQQQQNPKTHSYQIIPLKSTVKNHFHPNSCQQINTQTRKIKSKISVQDTFTTPDIHDRVKGVIQSSKKLIQKLRDKTKKNN